VTQTAIIDAAVLDREIDKLVDSINQFAPAGWQVEMPGEPRTDASNKVIRFLGMDVRQNPDTKGRAGSDMAMVSLRFAVGTVLQDGRGEYISSHHSGVGVSSILAALIGSEWAADGHRGGFDAYAYRNNELDVDEFATERVIEVQGEVQRESGTGMIGVA